jgi:hypothetical protein
MGVEITSKTLGIIGCGNIGSIVADRAHGLRMKVIAYDPFLSPERARDLGVEKVELAALFKRADFVTLHTPLTEKTKNVIDAKALATMKKGVRIINCARGGLVDEQALRTALDSGHVPASSLRRVHRGAGERQSLVGHPWWSRTHISAPPPPRPGKRGLADRRADVAPTSARRDLERRQFPVDHRGGSAAAAPLHRASPKSSASFTRAIDRAASTRSSSPTKARSPA